MTSNEREIVLAAWDDAGYNREFIKSGNEHDFMEEFTRIVRIGLGMDFIMQDPALFYGSIY